MNRNSLWQETASLPTFGTLPENKKTSVLVIGGGMAGLLTAYFLTQQGIDCIVVEQNRIGSGTTGNTTAKLTVQHGLVFHQLLKSMGWEKAQGYYLANKKALQTFGSLCETIDCDFENKINVVYTVEQPKKLEQEWQALSRLGIPALSIEDLPLPFDTDGGIGMKAQAQFHPLKFLGGIAKNLTIYENTKVLETIGNTAKTNHGIITADHIVVATHFPFANKKGAYFLKLYQHRSYVVALKNALDVQGMYVDDAQTGYSFRNYKDWLLLGGGGHRTGKQGGGYEGLRELYHIAYPHGVEEFSWAAQDCMSLDHVPYIGKYAGKTAGWYVASGFNKWGMTGAMTAAMVLSDVIAGKKNPFEEVFSPSRNMITPQLFCNAVEAVGSLLTPTGKRCPHMGCVLKWNREEHTWDCPCHGSRFTENGKVLNNPATDDMKDE